MLELFLGEAREVDPDTDPLNRSMVGWHPGMTPEAIYLAGRSAWKLGARADRERYALFVAQGRVRLAVEITGIIDHETTDRRSIEGRILGPGDEVHDTYVGGPDPSGPRTRNPIRYWSPTDGTCHCGCGATTQGDWLPGHDQRAVHEAINAHFRTVVEFLDWYKEQF
jgi:hypothetical protein